jgi:hypothetical protein
MRIESIFRIVAGARGAEMKKGESAARALFPCPGANQNAERARKKCEWRAESQINISGDEKGQNNN